jgi:hypothetical protein
MCLRDVENGILPSRLRDTENPPVVWLMVFKSSRNLKPMASDVLYVYLAKLTAC